MARCNPGGGSRRRQNEQKNKRCSTRKSLGSPRVRIASGAVAVRVQLIHLAVLQTDRQTEGEFDQNTRLAFRHKTAAA
jgi:hypothetical protein